MPSWNPSIVVVTGAGAGIGRATAERFAAGGATVICADIDIASASETALRINQRVESGGRADAHRLDVADVAAWEAFAEAVRAEHGVPDVVVNNAGIGMGGPFLDTTAEDWQRIVDINLMGVVHGCRLFGRQLAQRHREQPGRRGHLVNLASAAAFTPSRLLPAYVATKAAVMMLTEAIRAEMADYNVGVSAICPGFIATNIYAATTFVGLAGSDSSQRGGLAQDFFGRFAPGPDLVARRIEFAVRHDVPVLPVTLGAWAAYGTYHLATPLARLAGRLGSPDSLRRLEELGSRFLGGSPRSAEADAFRSGTRTS
jgi:NAD(P)-dependent dehydrogenase (short-subunit alcohol dehydrogenase family)